MSGPMEPPQVKVAIETDGDTETLWADLIRPGLARLDNNPFFAFGVSADDLIEVRPTEYEGFYEFVRVVEKSGNHTVRVISQDWPITDKRFKSFIEMITSLGCDFEGFPPMLVSINIPSQVEKSVVIAALNESGYPWEYADPRRDIDEPE